MKNMWMEGWSYSQREVQSPTKKDTYRISPFSCNGLWNLPPLFSRFGSPLVSLQSGPIFPFLNTLYPLLLKLFAQDLVRVPLQLFLTQKAPPRSFCNQILPLIVASFLEPQHPTAPFPPHPYSNTYFQPCLLTAIKGKKSPLAIWNIKFSLISNINLRFWINRVILQLGIWNAKLVRCC